MTSTTQTQASGAFPSNASPILSYSPSYLSETDTIILHAIGNRPALKGYMIIKHLDAEKITAAHSDNLLRCYYRYDSGKFNKNKRSLDNMLLKMRDGTFIEIIARSAESCIYITATTYAQIEHWFANLVAHYSKRARDKPTFSIVSLRDGRPDTTKVAITRSLALSSETMQLLYGDGFLPWEKTLVATMKVRESGVILLQGPPGTGKTSFIRHLIDKLKKTHRFYYMPVTNQELLTSPHMVDFWARECRDTDDKKKVIILEDAELLLERGQYGRSGAVANLLNIADGLLGELLKVQLLCTINCDISNLDEAIIRPGRLLDYREFPRLAPAHARRIAEKYSKTLPDLPDYALSDIFGTKLETAPNPAPQRRVMGFATGIL